MQTTTMIIRGIGLALFLAMTCTTPDQFIENSAWGQTKTGKPATAKGGKKKDDKNTEKSIDVRAEEIQESFVREFVDLAKDYEEAGMLEKSKSVLETLMKLNSDLPGVKEKIKTLDEQLLSANDIELDVDVNNGWGNAIARVSKNQPVRFLVSGSYKFAASYNIDAAGLNKFDPINGLIEGVPVGALAGMIVTQDQKTNIFLIGGGQDVTPKEDGVLFLKINLPQGHKSSGKLKVKISGNIQGK